MLTVILLLNAIWFGMGFYAFYLRRHVFAKVVVPVKADRDNTAYEALVDKLEEGYDIVPYDQQVPVSTDNGFRV